MALFLDQFYRRLPVLLAAQTDLAFQAEWRACCEALDLHEPALERPEIDPAGAPCGTVPRGRRRVAGPALAGGVVALSFAWLEDDGPLPPGLEAALAMFVHAIGRMIDRVEGAAPRPAILSPREADCVAWVARGKTNWEIGRILGVEPRTVQFHVCNAARKLGVEGRHQAVLAATVRGALTGYPLHASSPALRKARGRRPHPAGEATTVIP